MRDIEKGKLNFIICRGLLLGLISNVLFIILQIIIGKSWDDIWSIYYHIPFIFLVAMLIGFITAYQRWTYRNSRGS
ncbi:hypothetical protein SAMN05518855_100870 [Paenibacillus sp. CF384]|nr:hypothetical protein SAMN05518855_100870 [Paenibacillus sp. CF384]